MAFNIRPSSIEDIKKHNFRNEENLIEAWSKISELTSDKSSFVIDNKDTSKIKVLPDYEKHKTRLKLLLKPLKISLYFGRGSDKFSKTSGASDKTTLQEVGFLVALDMLLDNKDKLEEYVPSKRMNVVAKIEDVIAFLDLNPDWFKSSVDGAKVCIERFGKSTLMNYSFHHDTNMFNDIRKTGKKLSKLSNLDKWNPSDVYLIKNSLNISLTKYKDIIEYNQFIHGNDDIIGISLKKSQKEALHGAISLNVVAKQYNISNFSVKYNSKNSRFMSDMEKMLKEIKKSKFSNKIFVHSPTGKIKTDLESLKIESTNYYKSVPVALEFLSKIGNNLENAIKYAIIHAMSMSPLSCGHYKIEGSKFSVVPEKFTLTIDRIRIKLNGNTDTIFDFTFNNKKMKLQLRSKGSLPQFIVIKTSDSATDIINIKQLK